MKEILILVASVGVFFTLLVLVPKILVWLIYGPVTDPEHIASLNYGQSGSKRQRDAAPDDAADIHGAGGGEIFVHHRERI